MADYLRNGGYTPERAEEETHMERVYSSFLREQEKAKRESFRAEQSTAVGDTQESTYAYGAFARSLKKGRKIDDAVRSLYTSPYFAHLKVYDSDLEDRMDYYLSDSPDLDSAWIVDENHILLPFKQSEDVAIYNALFHAYQSRSGEKIPIKTENVSYTIQSETIRNVIIYKRTLREVHTLFSSAKGGVNSETGLKDEPGADGYTDELLELRLQENKNGDAFKSIIATLQEKQFQIIQTDEKIDFAVQGCAGSGKSQCLIHRLFFLRDKLRKDWQRVLLITPSQLFRNYSAPLMKRYHLTDIHNTSITSLYYDTLVAFDARFKSRQYKIELSEEFLPSEYLRQVYADQYIRYIEGEIASAIRNHVMTAEGLLGKSSHLEKIDIDDVNAIATELKEAIEQFDSKESALSADHEFQEKREQLLQIENDIEKNQRRRIQVEKSIEEAKQRAAVLEDLKRKVADAEKELQEWDRETESLRKSRGKALDSVRQEISETHSWPEAAYINKRFSAALHDYIEMIDTRSTRCQEDDLFRSLLTEEINNARMNQNEFCGKATAAEYKRRIEQSILQHEKELRELDESTHELEENLKEATKWIEDHGDLTKQRVDHREAMERSLYYLRRIESSVFEQEVWKAMAKLKEQCGIQTIQIEEQRDGRKQQTRILYKADLLFYLKVYLSLYTNKHSGDYRLICIDEGQDFHRADFKMLKSLYPQAHLNIFGDIHQAMHRECGVTDWKRDALVQQVFEMNTNYRNPSAIVDFVNREFHTNMQGVGKINPQELPVICAWEKDLYNNLSKYRPLIVLDRASLQHFCKEANANIEMFSLFDTHAEQDQGQKIPCYTVFAAKGLEFSECAVYGKGMTEEQKLVACTRAMKKLYYCRG